MLVRSLILKSAALSPVKKFVREGRMFRPLVRRFIAGESLDEALSAANELLAKGFLISLDYLGENTHSEAEALAAKETYATMLRRIALREGHKEFAPAGYAQGEVEHLNISIKLTQCGLDQSEVFAEANFREVLSIAKDQGNFVRVDMEASEYTQVTLDIISRVLPDFPNTGTVLQAYLYRTPQDVERIIREKARVRLVKGAYLEPSHLAYPAKPDVDKAYVQLAKRLLDAGVYPALATQDETIINELTEYATKVGRDKKTFEFQMLYGIRRDLQDKLLEQGYNVRVYIPFGDAWYPYFTRRLAERPANGFFILKNLLKG